MVCEDQPAPLGCPSRQRVDQVEATTMGDGVALLKDGELKQVDTLRKL